MPTTVPLNRYYYLNEAELFQPRSFACSYCAYASNTRQGLNNHVDSTHLGTVSVTECRTQLPLFHGFIFGVKPPLFFTNFCLYFCVFYPFNLLAAFIFPLYFLPHRPPPFLSYPFLFFLPKNRGRGFSNLYTTLFFAIKLENSHPK
jgi:hypothetical protein